MMRIVIVALLLATSVLSARKYVGDPSWVDPTDMLRYDPMSKTMCSEVLCKDLSETSQPHETAADTVDAGGHNLVVNKYCNNDNDEVCVDATSRVAATQRKTPMPVNSNNRHESPFMTRQVRRLLLLFNVTTHKRSEELSLDVRITLTANDVRILRLFVDSKGSVQDVDHVLEGMMEVIDREQTSWIENVKQTLILEEWSDFVKKNLLFVVAGLVFLMFLKWMLFSGSTGIFWKLLFTLFVSSIVWEWMFLYQEAEMAKRIQRSKFATVPKECDPNSMTYYEAFMAYFSREDSCSEYHAAMMIDSHWSVTPLYAASTALAKTFPAFGGGLGHGLGKFFSVYMGNFGYIEQYIMVLFAALLAAVFIIYPMTAAVTTIGTRRHIQQNRQRVMIEDLKDDDAKNQKRVEASEPSGSSPAIQQHYHNYYFTDKSIEKPDSSGDVLLDNPPPLLAITCPYCKSQCNMKSEASTSQEGDTKPAEVTDVSSTSEGFFTTD